MKDYCTAARGFYRPLIVLFVALLSMPLAAQDRVELGLLAGIGIYNGDLSPLKRGDYIDDINPAIGLFFRWETSDWLAFRVQATATRISAEGGRSTTTPYETGDLFKSNLQEGALTMEVAPFEFDWIPGLILEPYLFGGAALYHYNPMLNIDGQWIEVQPLGLEGQGLEDNPEPYNLTRFAVPMGGGLRVRISDRFTIGYEINGRIAFTDHLDDISNQVVNYEQLERLRGKDVATLSNPMFLGEGGDYVRGNGANDYYYTAGLTLFYRLGSDTLGRIGKGSRKDKKGCYRF